MSKYIYVANNLNNGQMLARFAKKGVKGRVGINYHRGLTLKIAKASKMHRPSNTSLHCSPTPCPFYR